MLSRSRASANSEIDLRTDAELLAAASAGVGAFAIFYRRNVRSVLSYFWRRTRDKEVAADLTAETFLVALEKASDFDPKLGDGPQWLHGIAGNLLKDFWRKTRSKDRAISRLQVLTPEISDDAVREIESMDIALDAERIHDALGRVPKRNREAVRLRVLDELTYEQIADQIGCNPGAARMRVLRGLRHLEAEFDQPTVDSGFPQ